MPGRGKDVYSVPRVGSLDWRLLLERGVVSGSFGSCPRSHRERRPSGHFLGYFDLCSCCKIRVNGNCPPFVKKVKYLRATRGVRNWNAWPRSEDIYGRYLWSVSYTLVEETTRDSSIARTTWKTACNEWEIKRARELVPHTLVGQVGDCWSRCPPQLVRILSESLDRNILGYWQYKVSWSTFIGDGQFARARRHCHLWWRWSTDPLRSHLKGMMHERYWFDMITSVAGIWLTVSHERWIEFGTRLGMIYYLIMRWSR
jgi:hypothetical protein